MSAQTNQFLASLTADKKKLSMMCLLLMVGLLLWGRLLLKHVPRSAIADPAVPALASAGSAPGAAGSPQPSAEDAVRPVVEVDLPKAPGRDLFALDGTRYARVPQ
jgi:hypothetical protein